MRGNMPKTTSRKNQFKSLTSNPSTSLATDLATFSEETQPQMVTTFDTLAEEENWMGQREGPREKFNYLKSKKLSKISSAEPNLDVSIAESLQSTEQWNGETITRSKTQKSKVCKSKHTKVNTKLS